MTPHLLDHLFVIVVLGFVFPVIGWWAYQRFLARLRRTGDAALLREYQYGLVWLLALGLAVGALWQGAGRAWPALGLTWGSASGFALGLTLGALAVLILRPLTVARSAKAAAALRKSFGRLEVFLPRTTRQLRWALLLSVFAGLFEELAYRGYLMAYFGTWLGPWGALAASSVLFGLAHSYQGVPGMIATALVGAAFGWVYLETGSLLLPVLLHAALDISSMTTAWLVLRREPEAAPAGATP